MFFARSSCVHPSYSSLGKSGLRKKRNVVFLHVRERRGFVMSCGRSAWGKPKDIWAPNVSESDSRSPCRKKRGLKKMNTKEHFGTTRCRNSLQNVYLVCIHWWHIHKLVTCRIRVAWQNVEREVTGLKMRLARTFQTADLVDYTDLQI